MYLFHVIENVQQGVVTPCIYCLTSVRSCALSTVDPDRILSYHCEIDCCHHAHSTQYDATTKMKVCNYLYTVNGKIRPIYKPGDEQKLLNSLENSVYQWCKPLELNRLLFI